MFTMNLNGRTLTYWICLVLGLLSNIQASERGKYLPPDLYMSVSEQNLSQSSELEKESLHLKKIKYYLINGETRLANVYLTKLNHSQSKYRPIIYRYNGMIKFIEGKFEQSLEYLSKTELQVENHYAKICLLKVLNQIVLNKKNEIENEWLRCHLLNIKNVNEDNLIWMDTLVQLKTQRELGITKRPFKNIKLVALENDQLKIFLKLALYLNQEKLIEPQIEELDLVQFSDPEIRELAGQILFRLGKLARSYRFIEDLSAPNPENIKGNLYILRDKYEIAYAQFKLAIEQKQNSQNAMERLIPLAWLLGDWSEGAKYSERLIATPKTLYNKLTLHAAFKVQQSQFEEAQKIFDFITYKSKRGSVLEVAQLKSFSALMTNKSDLVQKYAEISCNQFDMLNCWLYFQNDHWAHYPTMVRRNDTIKITNHWEKLTEEVVSNELSEEVYINQLDIEELDNSLIKLIQDAK